MLEVLHNALIPVHRGKQTDGNTNNTSMLKDTFFFLVTGEAPQHKESTGFSKKFGMLGFKIKKHYIGQ